MTDRKTDYPLERGLPASFDAERSIIGAILLDNALYNQAAERLVSDDFSLDAHRRIFARMQEIAAVNGHIDMITVTEQLSRRREIEAIGGIAYLSSLIDGVPERPSIVHYCEIVKSRSRLRGLIDMCQNSIAEAIEYYDEIETVLERHQSGIAQVFQSSGSSQMVSAADSGQHSMELILDTVNKVQFGGARAIGASFGIPEMDELSGMLRKRETTVLAGRPGHGKTVLAMQIALENMPARRCCYSAIADMNRDSMFNRAAAYLTGIHYSRIRNGHLDSGHLETLAGFMQQWKEMPLHIDDTPGIALSVMLARWKQRAAEGDELFFADFAQRITVPGEKDTRLKLNRVSAELNAFAKDYHVHVVILSQLAKYILRKDGTEPPPSENDLKESGNLNEDADNVVLVWNPRDEERKPVGYDTIFQAKNRNGGVGSIGADLIGGSMMWRYRQRASQHTSSASSSASHHVIHDGKAAATFD